MGFAFSPTPGEYPLLAAGLIYGAITGLALKFLLVPVDPPLTTQRTRWVDLSTSKKVLQVVLVIAGLAVLGLFSLMMFGLG